MPRPHIVIVLAATRRALAVATTAALIAALIAVLGACTKAKEKHRKKDKNDETPEQTITQTPYTAGHGALEAASPASDVLAVLLRFDHLDAFGLDDEVNDLMGILPDHRRVFGGSGPAGITGSFDVVYISTWDPAILVASTLAARTLKPGAMKSMLAYPESGVTWHEAPGGPLGELAATARFPGYDPRVYLMPGDPWIVLAKREQLGALADSTSGEKPAWIAGVPGLAKLGPPDDRPGKLLAVASARNLPARAHAPAVGAVTMPTRMIATATAHGDTVTFTGDMSFADESHARAATDAVATLRKRFERFRPVREAKVWREGATILWSTRASTAETAVLVKLTADIVRPMFPSESARMPPVPPSSVPPSSAVRPSSAVPEPTGDKPWPEKPASASPH